MGVEIPYTTWEPLPLDEVVTSFSGAPFRWCLAGGYAIEQFLGTSIRTHGDIDVLIYRDEQLDAQRWLNGWRLYAADPPGTLRKWMAGENLPFGIHDIWGHRAGSTAWGLQIMLMEVEGDKWFSRRNPLIRGRRDDLIAVYNSIPCIRVEVQLLYKAKGRRPKDELDFQAALPLMSAEAKSWLKESILIAHSDNHPWLDALD